MGVIGFLSQKWILSYVEFKYGLGSVTFKSSRDTVGVDHFYWLVIWLECDHHSLFVEKEEHTMGYDYKL